MTSRKPPFFWFVVAAGLVLLADYPFVVHVLLAHGGPRQDRGWTSAPDGDGRPFVRTVDAAGLAAGKLAPGDRILAVSGDARVIPELDGHFLSLRPGDAYTLRVTRAGADIDVPLVLDERRALPIWVGLQFVLISLALFLAGLLIGLLRPAEQAVRFWATALLVSGRVEAALHPSSVQLFWRDAGRGFGLGHASGTASATATFPEASALVRALESSGEARELGEAEIAEAAILGPTGRTTVLAVPIGGGERRLGGLLPLGPKKSEDAYTKVDLKLLGAIAAQIAIVHENAALKRRASEDARTQQEFWHISTPPASTS